MNERNDSSNELDQFFQALADGTRLRLLNLMRNGEVCVCFFSEVLDESQPKVSRHLAYLRNADLVKARRDGKWMHYSLVEQSDKGRRQILETVLDALRLREEMNDDLARYAKVCTTPSILHQIARTPIDFIDPENAAVETAPHELEEKSREVPAPVEAHNEIEDFLL